MDWNEENTERLKTLYAQGLSGSQMARAIGQGCSRNAVTSKCHRLGLTGDRQVGKSVNPTPRTEKPRGGGLTVVALKPKKAAPTADAPPPVLDAEGQPITLRTVGDKQCRWYVADQSGVDGQLCANPVKGGSWCDHHAARLANATAMQQLKRSLNAVPTVKARALKHAN